MPINFDFQTAHSIKHDQKFFLVPMLLARNIIVQKVRNLDRKLTLVPKKFSRGEGL